MQTMVEKLARVLMRCHIQDDDPEGRTWHAWSDDARAVLTALRDPTEGMVDIGQSKGWRNILDYGEGNVCFDDDGAKEIWQAMIDQALTEGEDA